MKVLYIGTIRRPDLSKNNSYFEFYALKKVYRNIEILDCKKFYLLNNFTDAIFHHISPKIIEPFLNNYIL